MWIGRVSTNQWWHCMRSLALSALVDAPAMLAGCAPAVCVDFGQYSGDLARSALAAWLL